MLPLFTSATLTALTASFATTTSSFAALSGSAPSLPFFLAALAGAVVMGLTLGLIGGGGSILAVPLLVYILGVPASSATYQSLFVVGVCAAIGAAPLAKKGLVSPKTALLFFLPSLAGVLLARRVILPGIPEAIPIPGGVLAKDTLLLVAFGGVMLSAAISMLRGPSPSPSSSVEPAQPASGRRARTTGLVGFLVGITTGFVGAGGGFLIVPALVNPTWGLGLSMRQAVGTSLTIIALNSLSGFASDWWAGKPTDWATLLPFTAAAVVGIALGTRLGAKIPGASLKRAFGWFVLVLGTLLVLVQVTGIGSPR
jgi:hypothetical protein